MQENRKDRNSTTDTKRDFKIQFGRVSMVEFGFIINDNFKSLQTYIDDLMTSVCRSLSRLTFTSVCLKWPDILGSTMFYLCNTLHRPINDSSTTE